MAAWCGRRRSAPSSKTSTKSAVKDIPGVVKVVREGNFLGVVATNEWDAIRGADALKATWSKSETLPDQAKLLGARARDQGGQGRESPAMTGNTAEAMAKDGVKIIKATYDFAIHTHGSIGPSCAVAEFKDGKLTSWSASQATHDLRKQLAQMFSLPVEKVRCIYVEGSGCYGRNGHEDAAADAALLAKAVGKPVRVQWSRADEHGWDPKGPPTLMDLRASLDAAGNVTAWEGEFFMPQQTPGGFMVPLVAATLAGMPAADHIAPGNVFQNSAIPTSSPTPGPSASGSRRRRSARPGSGRRGGCRTPTPTNASWTNSPRRPTRTRSSSA